MQPKRNYCFWAAIIIGFAAFLQLIFWCLTLDPSACIAIAKALGVYPATITTKIDYGIRLSVISAIGLLAVGSLINKPSRRDILRSRMRNPYA
jgi:hypothetical protein